MRGTEICMITETLSPPCGGAWFQTQLLKLYFLTTLYVDVKEPAVPHIRVQKNSILIALNRFAKATAVKRDKIEPICSPKCT